MKILSTMLSLALLAGFSLRSTAQITVEDSLSVSAIAQLLEGPDVGISNVQVNCIVTAMGHFSGPSELTIGDGLVLTTGYVDWLAAPVTFIAAVEWGIPGDVDLEPDAGCITYDACALEFDCIPAGDTLLFNFSFGSDEYPYSVGVYNDVMAVFVSGPDIPVPVNVALLPDGTPVTINNVNNANNSALFHDNLADSGQYVSYNGFTDKLTAIHAVIPGMTYHIKAVVADALDANMDSGLFLEAHSFRSGTLTTGVKDLHRTTLGISQRGGIVTVALPEGIAASELLVFDAMGRTVRQVAVTGREGSFDTSALPTGAYSVLPRNGAGVLPVRFVKE